MPAGPPPMFHPHPHHPPVSHFDFAPMQQHTPPSYYLIPASAGFMPPTSMGAITMMAPPSSPMGAPPTSMFSPPINQSMVSSMTGISSDTSTSGSPQALDSPWPRGAVVKTSSKRPQKVPGKNQFR
eukprot:343127_1